MVMILSRFFKAHSFEISFIATSTYRHPDIEKQKNYGSETSEIIFQKLSEIWFLEKGKDFKLLEIHFFIFVLVREYKISDSMISFFLYTVSLNFAQMDITSK